MVSSSDGVAITQPFNIRSILAPLVAIVVGIFMVVQYATWRWIFLLNVPIGAIGILIGLRSLPVVDRHRVAGLDLPGVMLAPLAFAALSYGINQGSTSWTSTKTIAGLLIGGIALLAFIVVERGLADRPLSRPPSVRPTSN